MMSQWAKNFTRLGRDGYNLARAMVQHRGSNVKPILVDHARQANSVATSLLHVDKEVGLMKYHGLSDYVKQRFQSTSALTTSGEASDAPPASGSSTNGDGKTAKIAFMVTASMKQELADLGYEAEQIKNLTPLQASLILNHQIHPSEMTTRLPAAEAEYEEQRQKEEEEARLKAEQQQGATAVGQQPAAVTENLGSNSTQFFGVGGGYMSKNELEEIESSRKGAFFSASEWFEIKEVDAAGEKSRVGLYQDEEEAKLGLKTRRDIAEAKQTNLKFEMHRIDWKDLQ